MKRSAAIMAIFLCLCSRHANASSPKVLLMIDEKSLGTIATSETESMAIRMLQDNSLSVVDQDMVRANQQKIQSMMKSSGDARAAAAIGLEFGADIVIVGDAVAKPSARRIAESNFRAYEAATTLKAVRTDNSAVLASASESATTPALDDVSGGAKALKTASEKALSKLIPEMIESWKTNAGTKSASGTGRVVINFGGMDQIWKLKAVREQMKSMTEAMNNVAQKSYSMGAAIFEADALIPTEELAEELVMNPPEGLKLQALSIVAGKLDMRVVESEPEQ